MEMYKESYFKEGIFSTDYKVLASVIVNLYNPKSIIEFGCGNGDLAKELSQYNIKIDAIDGYASPNFDEYENIHFQRIDLNRPEQIANFLSGKRYDIAISTEVAEHLNPTSSENLIKFMTQSSPVVIFSAAVPFQGGFGHINCQPRSFWHDLFTKCDFQLADSIREKLRDAENLAIWYKLNVLDYISKDKQIIDHQKTVANLIASESYASSLFYNVSSKNAKNEAYLNYPLIKKYLQLRNVAKRLLNK